MTPFVLSGACTPAPHPEVKARMQYPENTSPSYHKKEVLWINCYYFSNIFSNSLRGLPQTGGAGTLIEFDVSRSESDPALLSENTPTV